MKSGFTLVELSIVLVIIALIIGGVLVGRDLISAVGVRAQISQIEKYQTAVNTFRGKYGYLPGDIPDPVATEYGFAPRGIDQFGLNTLQGNGDWIIYGLGGYGWDCGGETLMFWVDLSAAGLIEGGFNTANPINCNGVLSQNTNLYVPTAKIGQGNYITVWSDACSICSSTGNYFGISNIITLNAGGSQVSAGPAMTVQQAYIIDQKIDDGLPTSGRVSAKYPHSASFWVGTANSSTAVSGSPTTCYDNAGNTANQVVYSTSQNNGSGLNCGLSLLFR